MRVLIFSDTHLTPDFELSRFVVLKQLITSVDEVIINGDFWDGYYCDFAEFINSRWSDLFPLLLKKQTVYIYGNHDREDFVDNRVNLFSVKQVSKYHLQVGVQELEIRHGHHIDTRNPLFHADAIFHQLTELIRRIYRVFCSLRNHNIWLVSDAYRWYLKKSDLYDDAVLQRYAKEHMRKNQLLLCGHSHIQRDLRTYKYLNTGRFEFGQAEYGLIEDGNIRLVKDLY